MAFGNRHLQILPSRWLPGFAKCRVKVYEHLDGTLSIGYGPHTLGRYAPEGRGLSSQQASRKGDPPSSLGDRTIVGEL